MKDKELFDGFNLSVVKLKEGEACSAALKLVCRSVKNPTKGIEDVEKRGKTYYDNITKTAYAIFQELAQCIEKGLDPQADEVQKIIKKHHVFLEQSHETTKEVYKAYGELYANHPEFRKQLDPFHSGLGKYMAEAMGTYADRNLS